MKKVLGVVVALLAILAIVVSLRPDSFRVERAVTMQAPAEVVFAQVADFHRWDAWSPWSKLDPAMKTTFEGVAGQVGSTWAWVGNDEVGEGKMTLLETKAPESLKIKLAFLKPFESSSVIDFHIVAGAKGTRVTWAMSGHNNFVAKAFSIFMDMDKVVGSDFAQGLASLTTVAEAEARAQAAAQAKAEADAAAAAAAEAAAGAGVQPAVPGSDPSAPALQVVPAIGTAPTAGPRAPAPAPATR